MTAKNPPYTIPLSEGFDAPKPAEISQMPIPENNPIVIDKRVFMTAGF